MAEPSVHIFIPDTQAKPGAPTAHLRWIGQYIADRWAGKPLTIIHAGDHADMPSLSSYDRGKKAMEGRRYTADILAANEAFDILNAPIHAYNRNRRVKWEPRRIITLGNHENRITRAAENDAQLDGLVTLDHLNYANHGWEVIPFTQPISVDGVQYCLSPHHRVLMADLTYQELGKIQVGDRLIGFDEEGTYRNFVEATVTRKAETQAPLFSVKTRGGKEFQVTAEHRFLARKRKPAGGAGRFAWVKTSELVVGQHELCKPFYEWEEDPSRDAGYLAGFFDGEGCVTNGKKMGLQISTAQNEGVVLDRVLRILDGWGVQYNLFKRPTGCVIVTIRGSIRDRLAFLARIGARRLIEKFDPAWLRKMTTHDDENNVVIGVVTLGNGDIVQLETTSGTLIVEGYAHHNCHFFYNPMTGRPYGGQSMDTRLKTVGFSFTQGHQQGFHYGVRYLNNGNGMHGLVAGSCYLHDEEYAGPQGNNHWRGIIVKHQVANGSYDLMQVSLDYLCRRYEKVSLRAFRGRGRTR